MAVGGRKGRRGKKMGVLYVALLVWEQKGEAEAAQAGWLLWPWCKGQAGAEGRGAASQGSQAGCSPQRGASRVSPSPCSHFALGPAATEAAAPVACCSASTHCCLSFVTWRAPLKACFSLDIYLYVRIYTHIPSSELQKIKSFVWFQRPEHKINGCFFSV